MAEFEFSLQAALDLRCREEEKAQRRFASAQRQVNRCRSDLDRTQRRHDALLDALRGRTGDDQVTVVVGRIEHEQRVLAELRRRLALARRHLEEAETQAGVRRAELVAASQARRTLERLSERQRAEHHRLEALGEQRELNEAAINRHHMAGRSPGLLTALGTDR